MSERTALESAHCVEEFSVMVVGATAPDGASAVVLGVVPFGEKGWTFPLPPDEARRIAALLIEVADRKAAGEPCWCCGEPAPIRGEDDPWEGRMDGYCDACSSTRCDTTDSTCSVKRSV